MDIRAQPFYELKTADGRTADSIPKFNPRVTGFAGGTAGLTKETPTHNIKVFDHLDVQEGDVVTVTWIDEQVHTFRVVRNGADPKPYGQVLYVVELPGEVPV